MTSCYFPGGWDCTIIKGFVAVVFRVAWHRAVNKLLAQNEKSGQLEVLSHTSYTQQRTSGWWLLTFCAPHSFLRTLVITPGPLFPQSSPRNSLCRLSKQASAISCPRPSESKLRTPAATSVLDSAPAKLLRPEKDLCTRHKIQKYMRDAANRRCWRTRGKVDWCKWSVLPTRAVKVTSDTRLYIITYQ